MIGERWVVLGVAPVRSAWFTELARWATAGVVPVEFVKCLSTDEVVARLRSGRAHSALLVDAGTVGLDRDLLADAQAHGCAAVVVGNRPPHARGDDGGVVGLPATFDRAELLQILRQHARPVAEVDVAPALGSGLSPGPWRGRLVAVTGVAGAGASTLAAATAQRLGADPRTRGTVALADLRLQADQAVLHDAREVAPGVQELVEAMRHGPLGPQDVRSHLFAAPDRGYDLLLGLRRHQDWTALPPRAVGAAVEALVQGYRVVVADVGADLEGEERTGSLDVGDRNALARAVAERADVVLVVGRPGVLGVHRLARTLRTLAEAGVPDERLQPVVTFAPKRRRQRAELAAALAQLAALPHDGACPSPVHVPSCRGVERQVHDGMVLPSALGVPLARVVDAALERLGPRTREEGPVAIVPGRIGAWDEAKPEVAG